jgi:hypothetical protein
MSGVLESEYVLAINASVQGEAGEVYSTYMKGEQFKARPARPTFTVTDALGRSVAHGTLGFG